MSSSWMLRAAAAPERFLSRGLPRQVSRLAPTPAGGRSKRASARAAPPLGIAAPPDLARWIAAVGASSFGDFVPWSAGDAFGSMITAARRPTGERARGALTALLAGAIPFGTTRGGELWLYVLGEPTSPSRGVLAKLSPAVPSAPDLVFRDVATFAVACALDASIAAGEDVVRATETRATLASPGVAEREAVRAAFERAAALVDLVVGSDGAVRRAAKKLAIRPLDVPRLPSSEKAGVRTAPLALGPMIESFFREDDDAVGALARAQRRSADVLVSGAAKLIEDALAAKPRTAAARDLAQRRAVATRAAKSALRSARAPSADRMHLTRRIVDHIDACPPAADALAVSEPREEALLALAELGDRGIVPSLVARAVTGDASAVEMLAALGDTSAAGPLVGVLRREPQRYRQLEAAVVRTLATLGATSAAPVLRAILDANPMPSWREGIERGVLVRELVAALGTLADAQAAPALLHVLEERGQEYRAVLPVAAWALGRIAHLPALGTLERLLSSPKETATPEAIWAVGAIGAAHANGRARAAAILDRLGGLEPGAEMVRLTALAKVRGGNGASAPRAVELRRALERALWEPGFRQEETAKRRTWALRSLEELAGQRSRSGRAIRATTDANDDAPFFLGHEAVRHFVTRDDHRVRRAAVEAFAAWGIPVPQTRRYFVFVLDDLEARGGLDALHDALRDPLGVFRHNVATRLAERGSPLSVRPLAEATARLFAEPPTSTYEYDDAPSHLVAFVRAVAKLNRAEGNDVLIEGLRAGNHQVRAVVAENAPDDPRFVPELMAMLGDPRSFLRSRAERSLASMGVRRVSSDRPTRLVEV